MNDKVLVPSNDPGCGWIHPLPERTPATPLRGQQQADWVVVGAGYTGLAAARQLARCFPQQRILLLEAERAGEGASARNSGFLVDSTLNDGHLSDTGLKAYRQKYELNRVAVDAVARLVQEAGIDCGWNPCGKFHAAAGDDSLPRLRNFSRILAELDIAHSLLDAARLKSRLGTDHYRHAVHTQGGVLLQPAALARGMIQALPASVELHEGTAVLTWRRLAAGGNARYRLETAGARVDAGAVLFAVNGFMPALGLKRDRVFPLVLTASLTRPLSDEEYLRLGRPAEWGLLSARPMGATLRLTADRRIMIRNTAEVWPRLSMDAAALGERRRLHEQGLARRFPALPDRIIESTWSGITCISANNANVFEALDEGLYLAGCYNGGGIGLATLFGEQIALWAAGGDSRELRMIRERPLATRLPPQPWLNLGVRLRLFRDRMLARRER